MDLLYFLQAPKKTQCNEKQNARTRKRSRNILRSQTALPSSPGSPQQPMRIEYHTHWLLGIVYTVVVKVTCRQIEDENETELRITSPFIIIISYN